MRILFYYRSRNSTSLAYLGVHIFEVLSGLAKMGHAINYADGQPFNAVKPASRDRSPGPSQSRPALNSLRVLLRKLNLYRLSLLFSNWTSEGSLFMTAFRTSTRLKPDIIYRRHVLHNYEYILARLLNVPYVKEVNSLLSEESQVGKKKTGLYQSLVGRLERSSITRATKYIVVTPKLKEILCRDYRIPAEKIEVIENGANTDLFKPLDITWVKDQLKFNQADRYICFSGALVSWQGVEDLLRTGPLVLKVNPNVRFMIVGDGEMRDELIQLSIDLGIADRVIFFGKVPYESVPLYVNAADICVVPKKPLRIGYSPLKLCEYMACAKPVVATRTDGFEMLEENQAGLLVDPQNTAQFAGALIRLLADPALRAQMGQNGRQYVIKYRSWDSIAHKVAAVCESAIREYRQR